jgi:two-component system chemotaxis response regulator CheY
LTRLIAGIVPVEERHWSLRMHHALPKARIPCYLEAYESGVENLFRELTGVKDKLSRFVDGGVQRLRRVRFVKSPRRKRLERKGSSSTVLIVGDDKAFRKVLYTLFDSGSGFDACVEAQNGVEAIAKTKKALPKLAIMDFSVPEMNGLQLAQELKAIAPELPIFLLTADYHADIEKEALSCGITAVFSKLDDLATLVANARAVCGIE